MTFDQFWPVEEALWLQGSETYGAVLHTFCLMAFSKVGLLSADAVLEAVRGQRWRLVAASDAVLNRINNEVIVLGYRAEALRDGSPPYRCVCTSTYVWAGEAWRLVQHQQSAE
jgi:hypothetical protein